jgi:hypothetical protein
MQHPNLTLDERAFEGLLSAAFTIQEHNDRQKREVEGDASFVIHACPHCRAKKSNTSTCAVCGLDEFRPGERLQRNWASMWLHSQDNSLGQSSEQLSEPSFAPITDAGPVQPNRISANLGNDITAKDIHRVLQAWHRPGGDDSSLNQAETAADETAANDPGIPDANVIAANHSLSLWAMPNPPAKECRFFNTQSDSDSGSEIDRDCDPDFNPDLNLGTDSISQSAARHDSILQRLSAWNVKLRFKRADVFLGLAVFVAATALLWPAAVPRRPSALDPWERALVMLGIAEPPEPVIHLQGDPGVNVWIDPHSALYYCPGEDQYGKTTDGRLSSQREAEMDRFEPASRTPCE